MSYFDSVSSSTRWTSPSGFWMDLPIHLLAKTWTPSGEQKRCYRLLSKARWTVRHSLWHIVMLHLLMFQTGSSSLENYQAFAAALPHHSALLNHLSAVQTQISETRNALQEAKESLGSKRADLVQLWSRNQMVEEMLRICDQMCVVLHGSSSAANSSVSYSEHLRTVPDILESLISEKRLLQASVLLVRSLKIINKQDMLDIGALSDLRSYLNSQETVCVERNTQRSILVY